MTSDEKVQFLKGVLGTVFFYKLLADFCSFFSSSPWAFIEGCAGATLPMEWYHTAVLLVCEEIPP